MGAKSIQKKNHIIEKAREVFAEKGYRTVTMKDIVEACDISRGGLYMYFDSTRELFLEVLRREDQEEQGFDIDGDASSTELLALFLKVQKRSILRKKGSLNLAIYEYCFGNKPAKKDNFVKNQFDKAVFVLEHLIDNGVNEGEFICDDPRGAARNIMYVLEGLRISAATMGISEKTVDDELMYIIQGLVVE